jgi:hypothetical protein
MRYNSPAIQKETGRIDSQIVGPAPREELDKLKHENKRIFVCRNHGWRGSRIQRLFHNSELVLHPAQRRYGQYASCQDAYSSF